MPKRANKTDAQPSLLLFPQAEPSPLSLAEPPDSPTSELDPLVSNTVVPITKRLDPRPRVAGPPGVQKRRPQFDSSREWQMPSRQNIGRWHGRLPETLHAKVLAEIASITAKRPHLKDVIADGLRLWLKVREVLKSGGSLDTVVSTGSSSCSGLDLEKEIDLTTTTTTLGLQVSSTVKLPTFAATILEHIPKPKSRHSESINRAYAWDAHRKNEGIDKPELWVISNMASGKFDAVIDAWLRRNQELEETRARAEASKAEKALQEARRADCRRCNGTCVEVVPGKGSRPCKHEPLEGSR